MTGLNARSFQFALWVTALTVTVGLSQQLEAQEKSPGRFEKEITAIEAADRKDPPAPGQIVFVGSSSVRLWKLKESFPTLDALNRGFGGSGIRDAVHFFPRIVQPYQPRQVVFYSGDNDIGSKRSPEAVRDDFKAFVSLMHKHLPQTPLAFISIKPSIKRWELIEQIRTANALIKAECDKDPLLTYVDIDAPMLNEEGKPRPELFAKDGLHMSPEGYAVWNKALLPHLIPDARASRLRSLYDAMHPWTPPATLEAWEEMAEQLRTQILVANGLWPMPEKTEIRSVIHDPVDRGDYIVERVYFASMPGHYVTGSLYRPRKIEGKIPAVLCPHGHWEDGRLMENTPAGRASLLATGSEKYMSEACSPLQAKAVELVRMGCVVFHYDMIGVADNGPLEHRGGFADADAALWLHNKMGLQTWNSIRALDFVLTLPDVDPARIGVTGASGGGTQTFLLGAIDPRVTASFPAVMVSTGMQGGCICENADYLRVGINNIAIAALFAPRPQAMSGADDWTIDLETKGYPELKQIYSLYGQGDLVSAKVFSQFPHNYNRPAREMMLNWFNTHLQLGLTAPVPQEDFWPLTREEMTVFNEKHPRPTDALKEPELRQKLRERDQKVFQDLLAGDPAQFKKVIEGAASILLPKVTSDVQLHASEPVALPESDVKRTDGIVKYDQARIPVTVLSSGKPGSERKLVLWLDGAGKNHLLNEQNYVDPAVSKILDAGYSVASADLFLTGNETGLKDLYAKRFQKGSPSHQSSSNDPEYTGFVYGYNRTPLAERVRDIQAIVKALHEFDEITLVGTGDAGLWALLASATLPAKTLKGTFADLNGFSFSGIKHSIDPNMVPGALKYGGIGGLATPAFPAKLSVFGAGEAASAELAPLKHVYQPQADQLLISDKPLAREAIAGLLK